MKKDLAFIYMYYTFCNGEYFTGIMIQDNYENFRNVLEYLKESYELNLFKIL